MHLVRVIIELRHREHLRLFRPYEQLYSQLTGKELPEKEAVLPGFRLNIADKKMQIAVGPENTAAVLEYVPNAGYCIDTIMGVFRHIKGLAELPQITRLGIRSNWIEASSLDFQQLVSRYKNRLYKSNPILDEATDVGAAFTLRGEEDSAFVQFGPTQLAELKRNLFFPSEELPKVATFVDVDFFRETAGLDVTEKILHDFISKGLVYAEQVSKRLVSLLGEQL